MNFALRIVTDSKDNLDDVLASVFNTDDITNLRSPNPHELQLPACLFSKLSHDMTTKAVEVFIDPLSFSVCIFAKTNQPLSSSTFQEIVNLACVKSATLAFTNYENLTAGIWSTIGDHKLIAFENKNYNDGIKLLKTFSINEFDLLIP